MTCGLHFFVRRKPFSCNFNCRFFRHDIRKADLQILKEGVATCKPAYLVETMSIPDKNARC
jgi:hypothetical protein